MLRGCAAWSISRPSLLLALFAVPKTYGLGPAAGDENIYFYMAERVAHGALPYRDFFFAHPPLHLLPGVVVALVGGPLGALETIPRVAADAYVLFVLR